MGFGAYAPKAIYEMIYTKNHMKEILAKCLIFKGMLENEVEDVLAHLKPSMHKYEKGEYIITAGEPVRNMFILMNGSVQTVLEDYSGDRNIINQYNTPGDSFCEPFSYLELRKSPVSYCANAKSVVMAFPCERISTLPLSLNRLQLKILGNLISLLSSKSVYTFAHMEHTSKQNIRNKILSYLLERKSENGKNQFVIPLSKTDLADFLFINRSAMTRELAAMKKDKLISFKGRKFKIKKDLQ